MMKGISIKRRCAMLLAGMMIGIFGILFSGSVSADSLSLKQDLPLDVFLNLIIQGSTKDINPAYKNVHLEFQGLDRESLLYDSFQRGVFMEIFPNVAINVGNLHHFVKQQYFASFFEKKMGIKVPYKNENITLEWALSFLDILKKNNNFIHYQANFWSDQAVLKRIVPILKSNYLTPEKIPEITEDMTLEAFLKLLDDPYTDYYIPREAKLFKEGLYSELVGIGVYLKEEKTGGFTVVGLLSGTAAAKAGILPGDQIVQVDDFHITDKTPFEILLTHIRGEEGTSVDIYVSRDMTIHKYTIVRELLKVPYITSQELKKGLCYMDIDMFGIGMLTPFKKHLNLLEKYNCETYVFDLRANLGGVLEDALKVLSYFAPEGKTLVTLKDANKKQVYTNDISHSKNYFQGKNIVLLIDENSASASEIFVGVIKEFLPDTTLIVGEKSYGKGSVQTVYEYRFGGLLKYTIAEWLIGETETSINHIGISPDRYLVDDPNTKEDEVLELLKNEY